MKSRTCRPKWFSHLPPKNRDRVFSAPSSDWHVLGSSARGGEREKHPDSLPLLPPNLHLFPPSPLPDLGRHRGRPLVLPEVEEEEESPSVLVSFRRQQLFPLLPDTDKRKRAGKKGKYRGESGWKDLLLSPPSVRIRGGRGPNRERMF